MLINLDPAFQPYGAGEKFTSWIFSGGEIGVKLPPSAKYTPHRYLDKVIITTRLTNSDRIIELLMVTDALKRFGWKDIELHMFYCPYARQDRVMVPGESLSLKVFADLINAQKYSRVLVYDLHNSASLALFDNIENVSPNKFARYIVKSICERYYKEGYLLISPDVGSNKKVYELAKFLDYKGQIIGCEKIRDVSTGEIVHTKVNGDIIQNAPCFIIDDIADGARSFVEVAKVLKKKGAGHINLIVSHGIFSKGYYLSNINYIFTTNSFKDIDHPKVTQIKLDSNLLS